MKTSRGGIWIVILFAACAAPNGFAGDFSLEFHTDIAAATSIAEVKDAAGSKVATLTWQGALPNGYSTGNTAYFLPVVVLGSLRDGLAGNPSSAGQAAHAWIQGQMGSLASTPLSQIPRGVFAAIALGLETSEWCGTKTDLHGHCPSDCQSPGGVKTCSSCGCHGTKTWD